MDTSNDPEAHHRVAGGAPDERTGERIVKDVFDKAKGEDVSLQRLRQCATSLLANRRERWQRLEEAALNADLSVKRRMLDAKTPAEMERVVLLAGELRRATTAFEQSLTDLMRRL